MSTPANDSYLLTGLPKPVASRDGLDAPYWAGLNEGRLVLQHCNGCGKFQWGPEWVCHRCHSFDVTYQETPAEGILYSHQRVWHPVHPALTEQGPYIIALVELPGADVSRLDGLRVKFADGSWLGVRPSNTEPVVRIVAESRSQEWADKSIEQLERIADAPS